MESIKLINKKTGKIGDYDIYLGNVPQTIAVEHKGGEGIGYFSLEELAEKYEIVKNEELQ